MILELSDEEVAGLARHLRHTLDDDPFPFAPRLDPIKAVLEKLELPKPRPEPLPRLKPGGAPRVGLGRRRG
jgi:hypothetical protein